jgi:hypothetical protein
MTENVENDIKIKFCIICNCSSEFNKFTGKRCTKCRSKFNNERLKEKQYYKIYYDENKELLLENVAKYYIEIKKPKLQNYKPVGRSKKNLCL